MDLFDYMRQENGKKESPLASRMRPTSLDEVVGQQHIIGKDKPCIVPSWRTRYHPLFSMDRREPERRPLPRSLLIRPAQNLHPLMRRRQARKTWSRSWKMPRTWACMAKRPFFFIDEIHRFNKGQQDYLLPFVEDGTVILIGATTENPYFEVNGALLSRSIIFELKPLSQEDIKTLIRRALTDSAKGLGSYGAVIDDDALDFLSDMANGDARSALTAIELGVLTTEPSADGKIHITLSVASECIQRRVVKYDKSGDNHYDTISAFIKSMRGSDPDAAIYYLARMLYAGEDVKFIARRIMICAAEDVGNADPQALQVAVAAAQAVERIGMPESQIILAEATNYVACAPKSNASYLSIDAAMHMVASGQTPPIPVHLQDSHYKSAGKLGHGIGYQYAHDFKNHYVAQQYLPDALAGTRFYEPTDMGYEKQIRAHLEKIRREAE